jgi:hypothetical protein
VLGAGGGPLAKLVPIFRAGLGGRLGNGRQWFSWSHLDDAVAAYRFAIAHDALRGPVNLVAPDAATNARFTKALAARLRRPAVVPVPAFALRLAVGGLAEHLLHGRRCVPAALARAGFAFVHPTLEGALAAIDP